MTTELTVQDIAAMRQQGDFKEFLRLHLEANAPVAAAPVAAPVVATAADRRPGAWPTGTQRPTPVAEVPSEAWAGAAQAYREWLAAGSPSGDFTCDCGCTPRRP